VKPGERWRTSYARSLRELHAARKLDSCFAVYGGDTRLQEAGARPAREGAHGRAGRGERDRLRREPFSRTRRLGVASDLIPPREDS
jgi:hypothetical protein